MAKDSLWLSEKRLSNLFQSQLFQVDTHLHTSDDLIR